MKEIIQNQKFQLFLTSFALLFLELLLIRFVPAYVRYLGYFTNLILLGAFLGIGIGCLLSKRWSFVIHFVSPLTVLLLLLIKFIKFEVLITTDQVLYFTSNTGDNRIESFLLIPLIFTLIVLLCSSLAQRLGQLLNQFSPLTAYTIDILGSIAGITAFTFMSILNISAIWWFVIFWFTYLVFLRRHPLILGFHISCFLVMFYLIISLDSLPTIWSPYQKVALYEVPKSETKMTRYRLYVNGISHQEMTTIDEAADFYFLHYQAMPAKKFVKALIIGSGNGEDVSIALKQNVSEIDAVEIDPVISEYGKKYHPEKPYDQKNVHLYINDARSFLEQTDKQYDLIIYALPDSTILASSVSSLRLESYLFTLEAFTQVKKHLREEGVFVLYNYYRTPWLIDKIGGMLATTFAKAPYVSQYEDHLAIFITSHKTNELSLKAPFKLWQNQNQYIASTDNWPFLYLPQMSLPKIYLKTILVITVIALIMIFVVTKGKFIKHFAWDFFLLGAAFLLIETKSLVNFNLLFGSTWIVNSLVFTGILFSVLLAIWVNKLIKIKISLLISLLVISLLINYFLPLNQILFASFWVRYILAILIFFSPIFFANLLFSHLFQTATKPREDFGANLIGAFAGGCLEYLSLLIGFRDLILLAMLLYISAYFIVIRKFKFI